jgi:hypothetical protein
MRRRYSEDEKIAHVKRASEFVANGGTLLQYIELAGISRSALSQWRKKFGSEESLPKQNIPLVAVGKVAQLRVPAHYCVISYYGATIEVSGEDYQLTLLKNIKAASSLIE